MNKHLAAVMMVVLVAAGAASADLLAYEGFDGYSAGDLDGQATSSTVGFDGETWSISGDTSGVDGWAAETGGLSYGSLVVNGGNAQGWRGTSYDDNTGAGAVLYSNSPLTSTTQSELYFSALINADNLQAANFLQVAWDHEIDDNKKRLFGFEIRGSNEVYALAGDVSDNGTVGGTVATGLTLASGTNLIVVRATDGPDSVELWLNPDLSNPGQANWSQSGMYALTVGDSEYGFDGFYLHEALNGSQSAQIDELRVGETFADVTPIPEPATMALLGIGGLGVLLRRRR